MRNFCIAFVSGRAGSSPWLDISLLYRQGFSERKNPLPFRKRFVRLETENVKRKQRNSQMLGIIGAMKAEVEQLKQEMKQPEVVTVYGWTRTK